MKDQSETNKKQKILKNEYIYQRISQIYNNVFISLIDLLQKVSNNKSIYNNISDKLSSIKESLYKKYITNKGISTVDKIELMDNKELAFEIL